MTDDEMAEEYVLNKVDKGNFDLEQFGKAYFSESSMKQAYLAGFKAGKPKWHDLRKDPNDLPKENKEVLNQAGKVTKYELNRGFLGFKGIEVIAWCDIPIFTGKE